MFTADQPASSVIAAAFVRGRLLGRRQAGASLVEYALLVALIALVCFAAVMFFGNETGETFSRVGESVQDV
jgi:pilus assembly protein Flp/PilA